MPERNRTIDDSGIRLDGNLLDFPQITGTSVTPEQAAALAGPLQALLDMIPYQLDERGTLDYRSNTIALNHTPVLRYGEGHPLEGELITALWSDGAYATRFGNAPMPFIDMDMIPPHTLTQFLRVLTDIRNVIVNAT